MATTRGPSQSSRIADFKQGQYSDGHPLDEVQYLECKLILSQARGRTAREGDGPRPAVLHCAAAVWTRLAVAGHDEDRARLPAKRQSAPSP